MLIDNIFQLEKIGKIDGKREVNDNTLCILMTELDRTVSFQQFVLLLIFKISGCQQQIRASELYYHVSNHLVHFVFFHPCQPIFEL